VRKCIIHFGIHKTGTTSIQQALFSKLWSTDAAYLHIGSPYITRDLTVAFSSNPTRYAPDLGIVDAKRRESIREVLRKAIAGLASDRLVISAECLSEFNPAEIGEFIDFLRSQNLNLEAVAYIREWRSWYESIFQQTSKYGTWPSEMFPLRFSAYRSAIEAFDALLGKQNVHLFKYDKERFPQGCVVRDFFNRLDLGDPGDIERELNQGISLDAVKFLRAFHNSGLRKVSDTATIERNILLANYMEKLAGEPVRFAPALLDELLQGDDSDLEWIESRLGDSLRPNDAIQTKEDGIRMKEDLENFSPESLDWLERESGDRLERAGAPGEIALRVAHAMTRLQDRLCVCNKSLEIDPHRRESVPRILWIFWQQGEENAPALVKHCIESWHRTNPGWEIRVLDRAAAQPFLLSSAIPSNRLEALPTEKLANILRLRILTEEGGVWTDASTFCLRPLDHWLPECMSGGFFVFRDSNPFLMVDNWFIASQPNNRLAQLWRDAHEEFWASWDYLHHSCYPGGLSHELPLLRAKLLQYFHFLFDRDTRTTDWWFHPLVLRVLRTYPYCVMHYIFAREYNRCAEWRELTQRIPYRDAKPCLRHYMEGGKTLTLEELIRDGLDKNIAVLKLKWEDLS